MLIVHGAAGLQSKSSTQRAQRTTENHREIGLPLSAVSVAFLCALCVKFRKAQEIAGARPAVARSIAPDCQSEETPSGRMSTGRPSSADRSAAWYTRMTILACSGVTNG